MDKSSWDNINKDLNKALNEFEKQGRSSDSVEARRSSLISKIKEQLGELSQSEAPPPRQSGL